MNDKLISLLPLHLQANLKENAYLLLDDFFGVSSLNGWRNWLHTCFTAAFQQTFALKEVPGNFLYSADHLILLVYTCRLLTQKEIKHKNQKRHKAVSLSSFKYQREVCIKHLTQQETMQPFTLLQQFFAYQNFKDWLQTLQLWKEAALSKTSITELEDVNKLMPEMELLYKLTEAAWLMCVSIQPTNRLNASAMKAV